MDCVYITEAKYIRDFIIYLRFNTGESGNADLKDVIYKYDQATSLRDIANFKNFYLDSWPTLAWECGFDIAPEALYSWATGKKTPELHMTSI